MRTFTLSELNDGTFTNCVLATGRVRPGVGAATAWDDYVDNTRVSLGAGTQWLDAFDGRIDNIAAAEQHAIVVGSSMQNGTVAIRFRIVDETNVGRGPGAILRYANASNFMLGNVEWTGAAWILRIYKRVGGGFTLLAGSANISYTLGTWREVRFTASGADFTFADDAGNSITANDGDISAAGGYGLRGSASSVGSTSDEYQSADYIFQTTTNLTHTYVSSTLDQGAAVESDTAIWDESLSPGTTLTGVVVRGWSSANRSDATSLNAGTNDAQSTFTATTHRYWEMEFSLSRTASTNDFYVLPGGVAKGLNAGGGGGGDTGGGGGGFGRRRRRTRVVVLTPAQAKKLLT